MSDLVTEHRRDVKLYEIGVVISEPDENSRVYEARRISHAKSEHQALMKVNEYYKQDDWDVERLRYIKKVYDDG